MRIVFMGSPAFAVPALERLVADGHALPLVVTQPDRAAGRGQALRPPAVKTAALAHGLAVAQPESLAHPEALAAVAAAGPEAVVVVAFGQFVPRGLRELPPLGCLNVHASLLPRYRGAAPIARAIMAGETETGVSLMRVDARMDAGPVLLQRRCPIGAEDTAGSLTERLAGLGADALAEGLRLLADGRAVWIPQDEAQATHAPKIGDEDCRLALQGGAAAIVNRVRALAPAPGAYLRLPDGRRLKVLRAAARAAAAPAGRVVEVGADSLVVGTGEGSLVLLEVQPEGKRRMSGAEFARGLRLQPGDVLANAGCGPSTPLGTPSPSRGMRHAE
ncbi:MAG: methionyl-tRNA formyltransferase [Candidatus Methylomirabilales bacterium]